MGDWPTAESLAGIGSIAAVIVSVVSVLVARGRARQDKTDQDIASVVAQVRALELDVAKNYLRHETFDKELDELATRLEAAMRDIANKVDELNRFLRREPNAENTSGRG